MHGWQALEIVPAFGIDTLAVSVGLGAAGVTQRQRLAVTLALCEGGMPIIGAALGRWLGSVAAGYGLWVGVALLAGLGLRELREGWRELHGAGDDAADDELGEGAALLRQEHLGWALVLAGLSVSVDELGAGLAGGAAGLSLRVLVPALAVQAALFTYIGLHLGAGVRRIAGRYGAFAAGGALLAVALLLVLLARH